MSVYTAAQPQLGQQQMQQPYGYGQFAGQQSWQQPFQGQQFGPMAQQPGFAQPFGMQQPFGQQTGMGAQQPFGQQMGTGAQQPFGMPQTGVERMLPQLVTQLALSCAATAVTAVVEQLRIAPEALYGIQAQGQIPPHVYSSVLTECARRVAPVLHSTIAPVLQGQLGQIAQPGQTPGQGLGQQFGQQQAWAAPFQVGLSSQLSGAGFQGGFGI